MFQRDKHDVLPQTVYDSRWHKQLMGWLTSLTLEDEARKELGLPWTICEYEGVFLNKLVTPQKYPRIFIIILLYIPGMN